MKSYAREIHATLDAFEDLLTSRPCVIAGDFNIDLGGDTDRRHGIAARLADLGYHSAYHSFHGAAHGAEEHSTYFHQFKLSQPFHIDLIFLPASLQAAVRSIDIGSYDGWVGGQAGLRSDHVPVTLDIDLSPR